MKTNVIYNEDCLEGMKRLLDETIDLIYIDPPFNSEKDYESYNDKWKGIENYISWIRPRVEELYRVLKPTGSFYLHCDWHANAHLRIMLDEIFGEKNFRNEVVWRYRRWPAKQNHFQRMHDVIFRYTKSKDWTWNQLYEELSKSSKKQWKGRLRVDIRNIEGKRHSETLEQESLGVPMSDVWEISQLSAPWKEYLGYPTQKPEALLKRIIKASSNKGDIVLDPFCGCGTTLAVAQKLERRWIGMDISSIAVKIANKRLTEVQLSLL